MKLFSIFFLILFCQCEISVSVRILGVLPIASVSHTKTAQIILQGLAKKGHNVTVITYFASNVNISNYNEIIIEKPEMYLKNALEIADAETNFLSPFIRIPIRLLWLENTICELLNTHIFKSILSSDDTYDVLFSELFNSDCMSVLADKFQARIVGYTPTCPVPWLANLFGLPLDSSYHPNLFLGFTDKMDFLKRVHNTVLNTWQLLFYQYVIAYKDSVYAHKYYKELNPLDITRNLTDVLISNCHFSLHWTRTTVPGLIDIAGIVPEKKPLPQNLEKWISEAKHGVIYFSMGSILKGHTFPKEKKEAFLKAFARLPQRVLWKWESEEMEGKPENVMIQKWMPQFDILSHPNVKVFITHGGLLGTIEAVHNGVPMIVMPQFGDQHTNAQAIQENGGGVILPLSEVTEETALRALETVLSSSFREQAKQLSERFRDRPLPPLETAIYWIEYVARHKGATHLRTAAVDMPFYQYYLLDVFGFLILILSALVYAIYFMIKTVLRLFTKNSSGKKVKSS